MQKDRVGQEMDHLDHATEALNDLTAALQDIPEAYAVFRRLAFEEQAGLADWIGKAESPRNRERRVTMICAVLTRTAREREQP